MKNYFKNIKPVIIIFLFVLVMPITSNAQNNSYAGDESDITTTFLMSKALEANFNNEISSQIWKDEKNTYYCIDINNIDSRYEEIRILEYCFKDNKIVNIGKDDNYMYFLVNNTLNVDNKTVTDTFNKYHTKAIQEKQELNDEQMRLWLIQHDKDVK